MSPPFRRLALLCSSSQLSRSTRLAVLVIWRRIPSPSGKRSTSNTGASRSLSNVLRSTASCVYVSSTRMPFPSPHPHRLRCRIHRRIAPFVTAQPLSLPLLMLQDLHRARLGTAMEAPFAPMPASRHPYSLRSVSKEPDSGCETIQPRLEKPVHPSWTLRPSRRYRIQLHLPPHIRPIPLQPLLSRQSPQSFHLQHQMTGECNRSNRSLPLTRQPTLAIVPLCSDVPARQLPILA